MPIKFDKVVREACAVQVPAACPVPPAVDPRCEDPYFRAKNPGLCKGYTRLIIKPDNTILCNLQGITFKAFLVADGQNEVELTSGVAWRSSDLAVVQISGTNGNAVGVGMGIATVSASWEDLEATAYVQVLPECCEDRRTGIVLLIDNSESMSQRFSAPQGSKLSYAKKLAHDYVANLNLAKDEVCIMGFGNGGFIAQDFSSDLALLQSAILNIGSSNSYTNIYDALDDAIVQVESRSGLSTRVIVILSDGIQTTTPTGSLRNPIPLAEQFKSRAGFILSVGIRAYGEGFDLLDGIASGGFFINAHQLTEPNISNWLAGLSGYFCAGNCTPGGDVELIGHGQLNYTGFANWDVIVGPVDLIGGDDANPEYDLFNLLPGNGLYVDLRGTPGTGGLRTKVAISFTAGNRYYLDLRLAGNQRNPNQVDNVQIKITDLGSNEIWSSILGPFNPYDNFATIQRAFDATDTFDGYLEIRQVPDTSAFWDTGALLDRVVIQEEWLSTDSHVDQILDDDFDTENGGIIPPECPDNLIVSPLNYSPTLGMTGYGYDCPGYGCLREPIPAQIHDPAPLPSIAEGDPPGLPGSPVEAITGFNPGGVFITAKMVYKLLNELRALIDGSVMMTSYLQLTGGTMLGGINMGAFTLSFGGDTGEIAVYAGHPYLKAPSGGLWHRLRTVAVDGKVLADLDQTGIVLDFSSIPIGTGVSPYMPLSGEAMAGGLDLDTNTLAFGSGDLVIYQGAPYLKHPSLDQWHKLRTLVVEGAVFLDVEVTPTAIDISGIPTGSGPGPYLPLMGGTMQGPINMQFYKIIFGSGSFATYQGHAFLKSGSQFYRLALVALEGTILLDLKQTPTTIP